MNRQNTATLAYILSLVLLTGCGSKNTQNIDVVSGAKSAVVSIYRIASKSTSIMRPSATIGVYSGIFTAQGIVLPVIASTEGFDAITKIMQGQSQISSDENFTVLREIGDVLQVDIIDILNRSNNRLDTINNYTQSLRNTGILTERKINEITATFENLSIQRKEERRTVQEIEKNLKNALKNQNYSEASTFEEQLSEANAKFALTKTKEKQAKDMIKRMENLLEITGDRLQAIENNREILIAGLRVINVPGISDLNILEKGKSWKKRGNKDIFGTRQ